MVTKVTTLPKRRPYLPLTEFQGHQFVKTKRELIARIISDVTRSVCVTTQTSVGLRNINLIPFRGSGCRTSTYSLFSSLLGPTHSQRITLAFSTSVFKDLIWILATTTKIDTKGSYIQVHTQTTELPSRPPTPWSKIKRSWVEYR